MKISVKRHNRLIIRFRLWARRIGLNRKLGFALALTAAISGVSTLAIMTGAMSYGPETKALLYLLYFDAVLVLLLIAVVAMRIAVVWAERLRGQAGSGLHVRLVVMFSLVAITPAILVAVFSSLFLNYGIEHWFSERVRTAIEESNAVAGAYLHEHQQNIRADALAVANDLNIDAQVLTGDPQLFNNVLSGQANLRSLPELLVINGNGQVLARSQLSMSLEFDLVPPGAIKKAGEGNIVVLITNDRDDRVRAVIKLNRFADAYLLVGRFIDPTVIEHINRTSGAVAEYKSLETKQEGFQITFLMVFIVVTVMLLLAAVWIGLALATQLVSPLGKLILAVEQVREGNLEVSIDAPTGADEIGILSRAFIRMTGQLKTQHQGLMDANRQLDERRQFTETVLSGVSAGVIGLDGEGRINLPNRSASELLDCDLKQSIGNPLSEIIPEMSDLFNEAMKRPDRLRQAEITLMRKGICRTLLARIVAERMGQDIIGYVVTFDDVTELMSAQRKAAWADVARRIAHEIKNPLTPIQLSAERLKSKYLNEIKTSPEIFTNCTDTIIRQVEDIGRMVDEFSSFARMPEPNMKPENLADICRQAVFLEKTRHPEIKFTTMFPDGVKYLRCDNRQIGQALINLLKNAAESVNERGSSPDNDRQPGWVRLLLDEKNDGNGAIISIIIEDNGKGLPKERRDRLTEPYITGRDKGTGLGLAIVKKIMEDHNGDLVLEDREGGGAKISIVFHPVDENAISEQHDQFDTMKTATDIPIHGS
ncbi:MAG: hypothetical protein A3G18_02915 [Rhodospirillales bacterium RIFCSPLOWO2_12_FULL_58_28]|nr:MAG: hypothetical protein A3H92_07175 [Rhodospirillales bacterium RIFCSPLOWO2_02_FULL_58_16]OHC78818.1 MAG: hypothetical protein A3G18_02915 [Rhodospirillales bacterium RIFCSPLOWO2_12_FULL_58_28]